MTTDLPAFSASSSHVRTGSMPPITSTTTSTSGRVTSADASVVSSSAQLGVPVRAAHGHPDQLDGRAHPGREIGGLLAQQPHDLAPDRAAAEHRDADRSSVYPPRRLRELRLLPSPGTHRATSRRKRSSSVSRRSSTRAAPSRTATTAGRGSRL